MRRPRSGGEGVVPPAVRTAGWSQLHTRLWQARTPRRSPVPAGGLRPYAVTSRRRRRPSPSPATSARPRAVLGLAAPALLRKVGAPAGRWGGIGALGQMGPAARSYPLDVREPTSTPWRLLTSLQTVLWAVLALCLGSAWGSRTPDSVGLHQVKTEILSELAEDQCFYFNARFYDAERGAFIGRDPKLQFWTPYSYVGNGPLVGVDPTGMVELPYHTFQMEQRSFSASGTAPILGRTSVTVTVLPNTIATTTLFVYDPRFPKSVDNSPNLPPLLKIKFDPPLKADMVSSESSFPDWFIQGMPSASVTTAYVEPTKIFIRPDKSFDPDNIWIEAEIMGIPVKLRSP